MTGWAKRWNISESQFQHIFTLAAAQVATGIAPDYAMRRSIAAYISFKVELTTEYWQQRMASLCEKCKGRGYDVDSVEKGPILCCDKCEGWGYSDK